MTKNFAPHIHCDRSAPQIYLDVFVALLPCCVAAVYYYGIRALILLFWGATLFVFSDHFFSRFFRKENSYYDMSSIVSGTILVLLLPPTVSIWTLSAGVLFSSVIVKQVFGGPGSNIFNPALAGRAFLAIAFSAQTAVYASPLTGRLAGETLVTGPAGAIGAALPSTDIISHGLPEILSGAFPGAMGITGVIFALMGGLYLLIRGLLRTHVAVAYLTTIVAGYWLFFMGRASIQGLVSILIMSGVVFCAVFSLGDYSTTPTSKGGRIIFGIGAGILTLLFFAFDNPLYATIFPVLIMNLTTPILDFYIRPRIFAKQFWFLTRENQPSLQSEEAEGGL